MVAHGCARLLPYQHIITVPDIFSYDLYDLVALFGKVDYHIMIFQIRCCGGLRWVAGSLAVGCGQLSGGLRAA